MRTLYLYALLLCTTTSIAQLPTPSSYFSFDNASLTDAQSNLTLTARAPRPSTDGNNGVANSAIDLKSDNLIAATSGPVFNDSWTVATYVRLETLNPDFQHIFDQRGDNGFGSGYFGRYSPRDNSLQFGNNTRYGVFPFTLTAGRWYHVAFVFDEFARTRTVYVDGVALADTNPFFDNDNNLNANRLVVGDFTDAGSGPFRLRGDLDELYFFDEALSHAEVLELAGLTPDVIHFPLAFNAYGNTTGTDALTVETGVTGTPNRNNRSGEALDVSNGSLFQTPIAPTLQGSYTIELWAKHNNQSTEPLQFLFDTRLGNAFGEGHFAFYEPQEQRLVFGPLNSNGRWFFPYTATPNTWARYVFVHDEHNQRFRVFVDGVELAPDNPPAYLPRTDAPTQATFGGYIGTNRGIGHWDGDIDDLKLYDVALLQEQVNAPTLPPDTEAPSAVAGVNVTDEGYVTVDLAWTAASDNQGIARHLIVRQRLTGTGGTPVVDTLNTSSLVEYQATGLAANTDYAFEILPVDIAGNRGPATRVTARTTYSQGRNTPPSGFIPESTAFYDFESTPTDRLFGHVGSFDEVTPGSPGVYGSARFQNQRAYADTHTVFAIQDFDLDLSQDFSINFWYRLDQTVPTQPFTLIDGRVWATMSDGPFVAYAPDLGQLIMGSGGGITSYAYTWSPYTYVNFTVSWDYSSNQHRLFVNGQELTPVNPSRLSVLPPDPRRRLAFSSQSAFGPIPGLATVQCSIDEILLLQKAVRSADLAAIAANADASAPAPFGAFTDVDVTATSITVRWSDPGSDPLQPVVLLNDTLFLAGTDEYTFENLLPNTAYSLSVQAIDLQGNRSPATSLTVRTDQQSSTTAPGTNAGLRLLPNPVHQGNVQVVGLDRTSHVTISDALGRRVRQVVLAPSERLPTASLASGLYYITVYSPHAAAVTRRLVVEP